MEETKTLLPPCLGTYEKGDLECNGNPSAEGKDKIPCAWHERCRAFSNYLKKEEKEPRYFLKIEDEYSVPVHKDSMFLDFLKRLVRSEINKKLKTKTKKLNPQKDGRRGGPSKEAKKKARITKAKNAKERREKLKKFLLSSIDDFSKNLKGRIFAQHGQLIIPGQFYIYDKLEASGYMGIRCKEKKGWDQVIALFKFKNANGGFDIKLPFTVKKFRKLCSKVTFDKLKPEKFVEGRIKSILKNCDKLRTILVFETLSKIINENKIKLPEYSVPDWENLADD